MQNIIMNYENNKSSNIKRFVSTLLALLLTVQSLTMMNIGTAFAEEGNPAVTETEANEDNITYLGERTLTGQKATEYINSWKSENADIVNPDANNPDAEPAEAAVIPWVKGRYGEYRIVTQTIRYRTEEDGVEVFKPVKRRVIFLGMTLSSGVPNVVPSLEIPVAKATRYIDEDGNTVKEAGVFGFLSADQYIYDADGNIAYVFKKTLPDTDDVRTHVYTKYVAPVTPIPSTQVTPKPETPKVKKANRVNSVNSVTPKTSDSTDIILYSELLGLSLISGCLILLRRKLKNSK
nr:hypothetical protein [uncultured Mogibacterium sp.]